MENKEIIVDRIEDGFAVCEMPDKSEKVLSLLELPEGVKEGTVLDYADGSYVINKEKEKEKRKLNFDLQTQLFSRKKK